MDREVGLIQKEEGVIVFNLVVGVMPENIKLSFYIQKSVTSPR